MAYGRIAYSKVGNLSRGTRRRKAESGRHPLATTEEARHVENEIMPHPCGKTYINRNALFYM